MSARAVVPALAIRALPLLAALATLSGWPPTAAQAARPKPPPARQLAGLAIQAPAGAEVTTSMLEDGVEVVAITHGAEVCLLTVYHTKRLGAPRALAVHVEELVRHLGKDAVPDSMKIKRVKVRLFKRWRPARQLSYSLPSSKKDKRIQTLVVAGQVRGKALVIAWTAPRLGIIGAFSPALIKTLKPLRKKRGAAKRRSKRRKSVKKSASPPKER